MAKLKATFHREVAQVAHEYLTRLEMTAQEDTPDKWASFIKAWGLPKKMVGPARIAINAIIHEEENNE